MTRPCQHHDIFGRQCMEESVPGDTYCEKHNKCFFCGKTLSECDCEDADG